MKDALVFGTMIVSFALLLTLHVTIAWSLSMRPPRWRALVALLVFPLAPVLAARERMRGRAAAWVLAAVAYGVARWTQR